MAAFLFLAFAYFAVGQATVARNGAQTAADAAALGAALEARDSIRDEFLAALEGGDVDALKELVAGDTINDAGACAAAGGYADDNHADVTSCPGANVPLSYSVGIQAQGSVGKSVIEGTDTVFATAHATAVIDPLCVFDHKDGDAFVFTCEDGAVTVDPTADGFELQLSEFFSVHLSE